MPKDRETYAFCFPNDSSLSRPVPGEPAIFKVFKLKQPALLAAPRLLLSLAKPDVLSFALSSTSGFSVDLLLSSRSRLSLAALLPILVDADEEGASTARGSHHTNAHASSASKKLLCSATATNVNALLQHKSHQADYHHQHQLIRIIPSIRQAIEETLKENLTTEAGSKSNSAVVHVVDRCVVAPNFLRQAGQAFQLEHDFLSNHGTKLANESYNNTKDSTWKGAVNDSSPLVWLWLRKLKNCVAERTTLFAASGSGGGEERNRGVIINNTSSSNSTSLIEEKNRREQSTTPFSVQDSSSIAQSPKDSILRQPDDSNATAKEDSKMKEERQLEFILKSLVAGGVAGMCAKTSVAPLDRMKILLQAHSKHYSHLGVFSGLKGIVKKERFLALYKGNGAQMVRIFPYAATQFTSFEQYKRLFGEESHIARFAAGSAAGVTAVALTYPLDTIRARLAFQVTGEHVYNGIYSCALHIFREEGGVRALYRGFIPTVCGMIPYAGLSFYCFESFKYMCMKYFPVYTCKSHSTNTGGLVLLIYAKLLCGGVAGAAAQTVAYPLDVTRRRMQLAMMDEKTKKFGMGMVSTLKLIYQENGVMRGLYRGMSINYLRAIPMVAVSFSTYELVKQTLSLDTGLAIKTG